MKLLQIVFIWLCLFAASGLASFVLFGLTAL